jgi:hypothetical protein
MLLTHKNIFIPSILQAGVPVYPQICWRISSELNGTINGRDVKDFTCTMLKAVNSCIDNLCVIRNTFKEPTVYRRLPIYHDEVSGVGGSYAKDPRPQWSPSSPEETNAGTPQYSNEDPHPDNQISKTSYKTAHDLVSLSLSHWTLYFYVTGFSSL